ncbi:hypothetical protein SIN07_05575 [Pediococcus inopinatus]|uniref:hypothetical protein n=1 Tax=Pediococcus inopinatus TaxID=114090 RepID=UPI002A6A5DC2|nr:hypothetical protein [Pediococcus inopinatus]WPP08515.1 hypothetical protein SIN07_05575 [Pediococcus inopinatus]
MAEIASFGVNIDENTLLAQNAQDSANDANKTGLDNNQSIKNINDPNYLSPFEKPQLEIQMANFLNIYKSDKNIATSEGIDFTAYDAAYQAYLAYMTPLIADMTTYSPIVRSTFNSMVTAVQADQKRFSTATQAQYNQQIKQAQTDIANGQTNYKALQSDAETMKSSVVGISDTANQAISSAGFASDAASAASQVASTASQAASSALGSAMSAESNASSAVATANSTASAFGPVKQSADSAFANAMSAQSDASAAVSQASSAAADSKDAKQIAGAVSQSYKTLTDGSTMTIAELQNGLAAKLTKTDLDGYSTQDWTQNQINMTADGINGTISSVKSTVDGQTTSINALQADSSGFKTQFTTVNDTIGKHTADIGTLQVTAKGLQSTVSDKVSSDQLTQLSDQLTNKISDLSSSTSSQFTQTGKDINGLVKKGDVVNQFNLDAGGALLSTSGDSTKIVFSSPNIIFDSTNPVQIPNANIPGTLTGKTFEAGTITATTKITGADIEAPLIHSPSGSFKLDGNTGDIVGPSIHSADYSWGIDKNGNINGATINGSTINAPTLDLGFNGTLTTDFNVSQPTSFYAPKKGTGTLTIKTGVINSNSQNMSRYSNTAAYWYGFDDNGNVVKDGTNPTGDDYAPGYEKHDIMKSTGAVLNRSYLDAMGLMFTEGGNSTYNTMLTGVGLETAAALLHKDLATDGTFEAALGTGNKYGFSIGNHVIAPMIQANSYTYAANMFISSYGTMGSSTSTKANKLDIVDVPDMLQKGYNLLTINPRQWFDKTSVEAYADVQSGNTDSVGSVVDIKPVSGMVAEEVASAGLDDYVIKDENNKVQGLAYDRLWTLLLPVLRDMNDKINKLQKKEGI